MSQPFPPLLDDVHSRLSESRPARYEVPRDADELAYIVATSTPRAMAICAGRHAMGGQQFIDGGLQIDMQAMKRVIEFDAARGLITVEAGIQWPALMEYLETDPANRHHGWGIRQKQTGADRFSIGGSLAANIHGRGLEMKPLVDDIESFALIDARGQSIECDRHHNAELFSLVIGGYGLFGVVASVTLRLVAHFPVVREVELIKIDGLLARLAERISEGCVYGDFQFAIDAASADFLRVGILSCYRRLPADTPLTTEPLHLADADWARLLHLAHVDKSRAFTQFRDFYLRSHGQIYRSDEHQAGYYLDGYHGLLDTSLEHTGTEVISELYVPRARLVEFMREAAKRLRDARADVIYGTVRLIERDDETVLAWAREPWACIIFNLHTVHTAKGIAHTAHCKQLLVELALACGGSYYLTYHRFPTREQLHAAHPRFAQFIEAKRRYDPMQRWSSNWYRHYAGAAMS